MTDREKITFSPNEHFLNRQGGNEEERVTDTSFAIEGEETKKYHLECQSITDHSMLVRFFEYDTQIALDGGEIKGDYEQIKGRLEDLLQNGIISEYTRCTIIDMSNKVLEHIAARYKAVREGVKEIMGGEILEYEAKTIYRKGKEEGVIQGMVETCKELGISIIDAVERVADKYNLTREEAEEEVKKYWN